MGNQPQLNDPMSNMGPQGMNSMNPMNNQVSNGNLLLHFFFLFRSYSILDLYYLDCIFKATVMRDGLSLQ